MLSPVLPGGTSDCPSRGSRRRTARTVRTASATQQQTANPASMAGTQWWSRVEAATAHENATRLATTSYTGATKRLLTTCATATTRPQAKVTERRNPTTSAIVLAASKPAPGTTRATAMRLTDVALPGEVREVRWSIEIGPDERREHQVTEGLVEHNQAASAAIRRRFEPDNLPARPVAAYAVDDAGNLLGGCVGSTVDVWHWLTVDTLWVDPSHRGEGIGRRLLASVEEQARERGCRWAKLNTWDFQAPDFYARYGYATYGQEIDFPPGHTNHLMRKEL